MKNILIDPMKQEIIPVQLSVQPELKHFYDAIECDCVDMVSLPGNLILVVDDEGMLKATDGILASKVHRGYFVLLDHNGAARNLIAGRGIVVAEDDEGRSCTLPDYITPASLSKFVRFIPADKNDEAAQLCKEILADCGYVRSPEHAQRIQARYLKSMNRAIALCRK
jgi:hypothetical protein